MEYYDSINRQELQAFYADKLNKLLTNPTVVEILDKNPEVTTTNLNLFDKRLSKRMSKRRSISNGHAIIPQPTPVQTKEKTKSLTKVKSVAEMRIKRKNEEIEIQNKIKDEVTHLDQKLNIINSNIHREINEQTSKFEEMKRKRLERQTSKPASKKFLVKKPYGNPTEDQTQAIITSGGNEEIQVNLPSSKKILKDAAMLKEIEDFVAKNTKEMELALEELRISFEDEINSVDETIFPDVVNGLKEDMKVELENLRDQYEEQRRNEIEKIRTKYLKRNSIIFS